MHLNAELLLIFFKQRIFLQSPCRCFLRFVKNNHDINVNSLHAQSATHCIVKRSSYCKHFLFGALFPASGNSEKIDLFAFFKAIIFLAEVRIRSTIMVPENFSNDYLVQ